MNQLRDQALSAPAADPAQASRRQGARHGALNAAMDRLARGDESAFDELYRTSGPRVRGFLLRLCGDLALADDLTQETFLRIHRSRGSFASGGAALPWMLAIARNALRDHSRRRQARPALQAETAATNERLQAQAPADGRGDEVLAAREMLDIVRDALGKMPTGQREAFI